MFGWRRLLRRAPETVSPQSAPMFVPAVIEAAVAEPKPARQSARRRRTRRAPSGSSDGIEFEIDGVVVRVGSRASPKAIAAVIGALKGGS